MGGPCHGVFVDAMSGGEEARNKIEIWLACCGGYDDASSIDCREGGVIGCECGDVFLAR